MSGGQPPGFPPGGLPPPGSGDERTPPPPGAPPPAGYGAPPSFGSAPSNQSPSSTLVNPHALTQRSPALVIVLSVVTCQIYYLYWLYATSRELRDALQDDEIKPGIDLLLAIISCSLWSIYLEYRNARKVHAALRARAPERKDQTDTVLMLDVAALFVGVTWLVATYILQEELNELARY